MVSIAICDDDAASRKAVRELCELMAAREGIETTYREYACAEGLLCDWRDSFDLVFLDVIMGSIDGVEASREIRKRDTAVTLVFMSNYPQFALEGYAVQAYRYLLKPVNAHQFGIELAGVLKKLDEEKKTRFTVHNEAGVFVIAPKDTRYIETAGSKVLRLHTVSGEVLSRGTLRQWEERLVGHGFFRCHNAYLVNLAYVELVKSSDVIVLTNGDEIPVSRHRRHDCTEALSAFAMGRI